MTQEPQTSGSPPRRFGSSVIIQAHQIGGGISDCHIGPQPLGHDQVAPATRQHTGIEPAVSDTTARHGRRGDTMPRGEGLDFGDQINSGHGGNYRAFCPASVKGLLSPTRNGRTGLRIWPMTMSFREALKHHIARTGVALAKVSQGSGVSYEALKKVMQREDAKTNVQAAVDVARYFGLTVNEFLGDDLAADRMQAADLWLQLTQEERALLKDVAQGRAAQRPPDS